MSSEINYFELRDKIAEASGRLRTIAELDDPIHARDIIREADELMALLKASSMDYCRNHFVMPDKAVTP